MAKASAKPGAALEALRDHALTYPETREDHPWGELVVKVRDKVFVFLGRPEEGLSLSVKLPTSAPFAFDLPYCEPTGYGLGKAGWITARFAPREAVPVEMLKRWIDESYRAVAPKRLAAQIGGAAAPPKRGAAATSRRKR
jgi:predicted DNA-binding protein (MmcQ/YjbR family)